MPQTFPADKGRIRQLTADEATVLVWRNDSAAQVFTQAVEEIEDEAPVVTPRIEALIIVCAQCLNLIRNAQSWACRA